MWSTGSEDVWVQPAGSISGPPLPAQLRCDAAVQPEARRRADQHYCGVAVPGPLPVSQAGSEPGSLRVQGILQEVARGPRRLRGMMGAWRGTCRVRRQL